MFSTCVQIVLVSILTGLFYSSSSAQIANSIQVLIDKSHDQELTKEEYNAVLIEFSHTEQFANGLVYANKFVDLCKKTKDTAYLVKAINRKAEHLTDLSRIEEGIAFCEKEVGAFRPQDSIDLQLLCFKWGVLYKLNGEFQKGLEIYQKIRSLKYTEMMIYRVNVAEFYQELGDYDNACFHLYYILENELFDHSDSKGIALNNLSSCLMELDKYENVSEYLDTASVYMNKKQRFYHIAALYENYFKLYKKQERIGDAVRMLDSVRKYNQLTFDQKLKEEIVEIKGAAKRENNLKQKVRVVDDKIEWYERQILLWVIIVLVVIVSIILFFVYRNLKAKNNLIVLEQKLLRSQMTPHFIFNSLSVIQGMILDKKESKAVSYLTKFSKLMREILENSRSKFITLDEELGTVRNYIELQQLQMNRTLSYSIDLDPEIKVDQLFIPPMLLQPFVENCVEHGFKGSIEAPTISLSIQKAENSIVVEIVDNGIGLKNGGNLKRQKKSMSTSITKERLAILSKEYKTDSSLEITDRNLSNEQGVSVKLILPQITD